MNITRKTITIIIYFVIIIVVCLFIFVAFKGNYLNNNSEVVTKLYSMLGSNDLSICNGLLFYSNEKITIESLSVSDKLCLAYSHLENETIIKEIIRASKKKNFCQVTDDIKYNIDNADEKTCNIIKFKVADIKQIYFDLFNDNLISNMDFYINDNIECKNDEDYYYCGLSNNQIEDIIIPKIYKSIEKAKLYKENIEIYDYFMMIDNNICYKYYNFDSRNDLCTEKMVKDINYQFLAEYGTHYKHTFKLIDNTYYWIKSEVLN